MNIFDINLNNVVDNCGICQYPLDSNENRQIYCLKECNHSFHTDCIISWFRTRNNRCPLCGNSGINHLEDVFGHFGTSVEVAPRNSILRRSIYFTDQQKERYEMLIHFSKQTDAPTILKKIVKQINVAKEKWTNSKITIKEFQKKKHDNISPNEIKRMEAKYRRDTFKYYKKYNSKRTALVNLPIIPVIIPQYIDYH
jgi:hypothetical protein